MIFRVKNIASASAPNSPRLQAGHNSPIAGLHTNIRRGSTVRNLLKVRVFYSQEWQMHRNRSGELRMLLIQDRHDRSQSVQKGKAGEDRIQE